MLPSVTRQYHDKSTQEYFQFAFYCDRCGSVWTSETYPFSLGKDKPKTVAEKEARNILWKTEHDFAYERANIDALFQFSKCSKCKRRVCDKCFSELGDTCIDCEIKYLEE